MCDLHATIDCPHINETEVDTVTPSQSSSNVGIISQKIERNERNRHQQNEALKTKLPTFNNFDYQSINVRKVKGCLSKCFFTKPDKNGDFSGKIPCHACGELLKPNPKSSTTLKDHAKRKHKVVWEYLESKRDGTEFIFENETVLTANTQSTKAAPLLRDIRDVLKRTSAPYDHDMFEKLVLEFVVEDDQSLLVRYIIIY